MDRVDPEQHRPEREAATVVAWFDTAEDAVEAAKSLERHGIDGAHIDLPARATTVDDTADADDRFLGRRTLGDVATGATIGAFLAVALVLVIALVADISGAALAASIVGATFAGAAMGGFFRLMTDLPANPDAIDAESTRPSGAGAVTIEVHDHDRQLIEETIRAHSGRVGDAG